MTTDRTTEEQHVTEQQTPTPPSGSNTAASAGVGGTRGRGGVDGGGEDASGRWQHAPGHYDGDGCTFPTPDHFVHSQHTGATL